MDISTYRQRWRADVTRDVHAHRQLLLLLIQINAELIRSSAEQGNVSRSHADDLIECLDKSDALWSILQERDDHAPVDGNQLVRVELKG